MEQGEFCFFFRLSKLALGVCQLGADSRGLTPGLQQVTGVEDGCKSLLVIGIWFPSDQIGLELEIELGVEHGGGRIQHMPGDHRGEGVRARQGQPRGLTPDTQSPAA